MVETQNKPLVDRIPDAETVRARLAEALREVELLRRMLKLSQQAEKYRVATDRAKGVSDD